jgi:spore maturation protein CgeB
MRADQLKQILKPEFSNFQFDIIDTHIPFYNSQRLWRSLGFRYKKGPLISKINRFILNQLDSIANQQYGLIWVDKAIFLTPKTTAYLKSLTNKLVHFTPDPAFTFHKSHLFRSSLYLYDYAITTKAYEIKDFEEYLSPKQIIYATQGFDKSLHQPLTPFKQKKKGVLFIGHHEDEREVIIQKLINEGIAVTVAGIKWQLFADKNKTNQNFKYIGNGVYGEDYVKTLASYQFSWGSVSKWIPELHTTRTFEIPACGTALITERNTETENFFNENEAIFYDSIDGMIEEIKHYQTHPTELELLTKKGTLRVHQDGRDYESILRKVLQQINLL